LPFPTGHLAEHPVPPGIAGALSLGGYQLLADVGGVGAGRLGSQIFLLAVADPGDPDPLTHVSLHQPRLRDEADAATFVQLAAQLGYLRLSGYRVAPERAGLRSRLRLINPATGAIAVEVPDKHPGGLFGGGRGAGSAAALLGAARALPPAGPPPDLGDPELLRGVLLALALRDESLDGVEAAETADRALRLIRADSTLDPARALQAARAGELPAS
jgi:hypothetical protein